MPTLIIDFPDALDAVLTQRAQATGAKSKEEYLLGLVESDSAAGALERVLAERIMGPFLPLESDWKESVRNAAAGRPAA